MKKILASLFILFIFQNGVYANATMDKVMDSWKGENIDTVLKYWGYPSEEKSIAGHKLLYWYRKNNPQYVQNSAYIGTITQEYCTRILEINKHNTVISWQYEGNDCPSFYFTSQNWVNPNNDPWQKEKMQKKLRKQENKKLKKEKKDKDL